MTDQSHRLCWDDLRIVRAIGETGALASAAITLGVNNSTIARRLSKTEGLLGVTLFVRRRSGYVPTSAGAELIALAGQMELDVVSVTRRVSGHLQEQVGELRVTTTDSLLLHFLMPIIASFKERNPAVSIEVIVGNDRLNLARGESDVAIRATQAPPENLFGRKLASVAWAPYIRASDLGLPDEAELYDRQWISYGGALSGLKAAEFVERHVRRENIMYRTDSVAGAAAAIAAGLGAGYLPCMHGDVSPTLRRVGPIEPGLSDELWLLTHPDRLCCKYF